MELQVIHCRCGVQYQVDASSYSGDSSVCMVFIITPALRGALLFHFVCTALYVGEIYTLIMLQLTSHDARSALLNMREFEWNCMLYI